MCKINISNKKFCTYYYLFITLFFLFYLLNNNAYTQTTVTFNYTGAIQTWTVPTCVYTITVKAKGAQGGGGNGGYGAEVNGNISVTPGQVLQIYVGGTSTCPGSGWNGGGYGPGANTSSNAGCGGGGATDIRVAPYGLANRLVVAAGGGGMGGGDTDAQAGSGGCNSGGSGASPFGVGGGGAAQSSGGTAGPPWISSGLWGIAGSLGNGGNGGSDPCYNKGPGGGGGGGLYGGGGGGSDCYSSSPLGGGGGGGGSSLTPSGGSCSQGSNSGNGYLTITYSPNAVAGVVSASPSTVCAGSTTILTVTGSVGTIQWQNSTDGGITWNNLSGVTNTTYTTPQLLNNTCYRVSANCGTTVYSNTVCITVNPVPVATATPSSQYICSGESFNISLSSNITGTTYNWSVIQTGVSGSSSGSGASISQTLTTTGSSTGTATYTVTPTSNGCSGSPVNVNITVQPSPAITISATPQVICYGESTTISASGANSYSWDNGLGSGNTHTITPTSTTIYTVTSTNTYGCTATNSITITVNPNPVVTITPPSPSICNGESISLQGNGANYYAWSTGDTTQSITVSPSITTTYTVIGANSYSCTDTETVIVTVNQNPVATITPASPAICIGNSINISASGGTTYLWDDGSSSQNITVSPSVTTTYTVTVGDNNNCTATNNVILTVNIFPPANAGNDTSACKGNPVNLTASGGTSYLWSTSQTTNSISVAPATTTTYIVTVTDANGCSGTDNVIVTVNPIPVVSISPPNANICLNDSVLITASGATSYSWIPSTGLSNALTDSPVAYPVTTTTYYVTGTNQYGCTDSESVVIDVEPPPVIIITPGLASICTGKSINLVASGASSYSWSPANGLSSSSGASVTAYPLLTTDYTITGYSLNGCVSDTNITVTVLPSPVVYFTADVLSGCVPITVSFSDSSSGNIQSWLWNFGDPASGSLNSSSFSSPSHTFQTAGTFDITLYVTSKDGCNETLTIPAMINVFPKPDASFMMQPNIGSMNQPTISFTDQSTNASYWLWNFGEQITGNANYSTTQNTSHTYTAPGEYNIWLIVSSANNCVDSTSNSILIQDSYTFWAPNAFTPNDDGINDYFIPKGTGIDPDKFSMYIFDRWGKVIFYTDSFNSPWDGTIRESGIYASQGVYTWVIYVSDNNGMERRYTGHVTLIP